MSLPVTQVQVQVLFLLFIAYVTLIRFVYFCGPQLLHLFTEDSDTF